MIIFNPSLVILIAAVVVCFGTTAYMLYETFRSRSYTQNVKRRERSIQYAEALQDYLMERVFNPGIEVEGFAELTLAGEFIRADEVCGALVGWKANNLVGKRESDLASLETFEAYNNLMERLVEGEIPTFSLVKTYTGEDKVTRRVAISKYVSRDSAGAPKSFFKVFSRE